MADSSAVAAVEFAIIAPVLFFLAIMMLDFGHVFNVKLKMTNAVTSAAQYAFSQGRTINSDTVETYLANVRTVVIETAGVKHAPTATVLFNNSPSRGTADDYYCISGSPVSWVSMGQTSKSCGGSVSSGKFVTITLSGKAPSFFLTNPVFGSFLTIEDEVIVRVQ